MNTPIRPFVGRSGTTCGSKRGGDANSRTFKASIGDLPSPLYRRSIFIAAEEAYGEAGAHGTWPEGTRADQVIFDSDRYR